MHWCSLQDAFPTMGTLENVPEIGHKALVGIPWYPRMFLWQGKRKGSG